MIASLTAQNKDLKRKVGAADIRLGRTEKAQRSSTSSQTTPMKTKCEHLAVIVIIIVVKA